MTPVVRGETGVIFGAVGITNSKIQLSGDICPLHFTLDF